VPEAQLLEGIRVVEVATMVLVPSVGAVMADFGAEVIKVEVPGPGDIHRHGHRLPGMPVSDIPYVFEVDNRGKQSIVLDLKSEAGGRILRELVARADVFITNHRPAALRKLGLTYEDLEPLNPRLIHGSASGYGERGPEVDKPGYDMVCYWSRSGIESQMFPPGGWLGPIPYGSGDHPSGLALLSAILLALYRRERTGRGSRVSTSLLACGAWANSNMLMAELCGAEFQERRPREQAYSYAFLYYTTRDDRKLKLSVYKHDELWKPFCLAMQHPELVDDPRWRTLEARLEHMPELVKILDETFSRHDLEHWTGTLEKYDIPFTALPTYEEVASDPQMAANDVFLEVDHPRHGLLRTVNSPIEVEGERKRPPTPAPELGQHTRQVLRELEYGEAEIQDLLDGGAAVQAQEMG
jgi:formyl-CoA transferase